MQAPDEAVELTILYIRICGAGFIFVVFYNLISCIFRGLGNSNLPLLFVGIACVVNVILDLILIAGFKLNVIGAAIATVAAQAVSVLLSLLIIRKQKLPFEFHINPLHPFLSLVLLDHLQYTFAYSSLLYSISRQT